MAELAEAANRLDYYLDYVEGHLAELEENELSWTDMSPEDRSDFLLEWPVVDDKIKSLKRLVEREGVPPDRRERYERLMRRLKRDRQILDRLWGSSSGTL